MEDEDEELWGRIMNEWVEYESDDLYSVVEGIVGGEVEGVKERGKVEKVCVMKG